MLGQRTISSLAQLRLIPSLCCWREMWYRLEAEKVAQAVEYQNEKMLNNLRGQDARDDEAKKRPVEQGHPILPANAAAGRLGFVESGLQAGCLLAGQCVSLGYICLDILQLLRDLRPLIRSKRRVSDVVVLSTG